MQYNYTGTALDLQRFADGAAAAAGAAVPADTTGTVGSSRRPTSGDAGRETPPAAAENTPPAAGEEHSHGTENNAEAKRKAFRALIEGEYREQYQELFQNAFNRRFRESKGMESRLAAQQPVLELLQRRYGVEPGDMKALRTAIEKDEGYWRAAAEQAGMSVEQYRQFEQLREDSRQLHQLRRQQKAADRMHGWVREADALRSRYPSFDFRAELADPQFRSLLRSGVGVRQAYELGHMEEIKTAAARAAAHAAGEQLAARIRSSTGRPVENGISDRSAAVTGSDVRSLTPAQRREIARRVQRGDRIRF